MAQTIGRYEIGRELGRGAQSVVYLAWDPQLQRDVAIKTMHFDEADAQIGGMLLAEARTVSKLHHANVVPIYDAGLQEGDPYLVFEYVQGPTLADLLRDQGPMEPARAATLMRQVMDALSQAHGLGIIHRDLKPSNILIDASGLPRVMDFGIATLVTQAADAAHQGLMGTPSYLAPEYVSERRVSEQVDVYAAGLILLELVTGQKVVTGASVGQILYRVLNDPVVLPPDFDARLGAIVLKACARDTARRYANASLMRQALDEYLQKEGVRTVALGETDTEVTVKFLLRRMRNKGDFPALADSVSAINQLADSDKQSLNKLSATILRDYALTNKILRLVNSAYYWQAGGGSISTISKAVVVLGFNTIRNLAINLTLFEHMKDKANARELKESFLKANLAALVARGICKKLGIREWEEAFICALFHDLGRLLTLFYFPEEAEAISALERNHLSEEQAATQVLGITFEALGIGIAHSWGFPPSISGTMHHLPEGQIVRPGSVAEKLQVVAGFANELCSLIVAATPETCASMLSMLDARFINCPDIVSLDLFGLVEEGAAELRLMMPLIHVVPKESLLMRQLAVFRAQFDATSTARANVAEEPPLGKNPDRTLDGTLDGTLETVRSLNVGDKTLVVDQPVSPEKQASQFGGSSIATSRSELALAKGIERIRAMAARGAVAKEILGALLEAIYNSGCFRRVLLFLRDAKRNEMVGRAGLGADATDVARRIRFPLAFSPDVFHLITSKGMDIQIDNIDDPQIADKIPGWFRETVGAPTFVLFHLSIKNTPFALIYCDKSAVGSIQITALQSQLLKALRDEAVVALKRTL